MVCLATKYVFPGKLWHVICGTLPQMEFSLMMYSSPVDITGLVTPSSQNPLSQNPLHQNRPLSKTPPVKTPFWKNKPEFLIL